MAIKRTTIAALSLSAAAFVTYIALPEGFVGEAMIPTQGDRPTVGFGSTFREDGSPVQLGDTITPPKALARALTDIQKYEGAIRRCVKVPLHQHEYDAAVSLAYNVGTGAFCRSILVRKLNAEDYAGACEEFLRWRYYKGQDCSLPENKRLCGGLWTRRQAERAACLGLGQ